MKLTRCSFLLVSVRKKSVLIPQEKERGLCWPAPAKTFIGVPGGEGRGEDLGRWQPRGQCRCLPAWGPRKCQPALPLPALPSVCTQTPPAPQRQRGWVECSVFCHGLTVALLQLIGNKLVLHPSSNGLSQLRQGCDLFPCSVPLLKLPPGSSPSACLFAIN